MTHKNLVLKRLSQAVALAMVACATEASADTGGKNIGDLEIYRGATAAQTHLMMMLDTSGSMGISSLVIPKNNPYGSPGDVDQPLCTKADNEEEANVTFYDSYTVLTTKKKRPIKRWKYDAPAKPETVTVNGKSYTYHMRGCYNQNSVGKTTEVVYDRLSRLKKALIDSLADKSIDDKVVMGLGHFSSYTPYKVAGTQNRLVDSHSGTILVEAAPLTPAHREKLIQAILRFKAVDSFTDENGTPNPRRAISSLNQPDEYKAAGGTPTAHAYAEVGAAMLGTHTGSVFAHLPPSNTMDLVYDGYAVMQGRSDDWFTKDNTQQLYFLCDSLGTGKASALGKTDNVIQCNNDWGTSYGDSYEINAWGSIRRNDKSAAQRILKTAMGSFLGGWKRVPYEPLDSETVTAKVWGTAYGDNLVTYRTSPFAIKQIGQCPPDEDDAGGGKCQRYNRSTHKIRNYSCKSSVPSGFYYIRQEDWNYTGKNWLGFTKQYVGTMCHYGQIYSRGKPDEAGYNMGGFDYSTAAAKTGGRYTRVAKEGKCSANGIYFLTDGAPNSSRPEIAANIMNLSLGGTSTFNATPPSSGLVSPRLPTNLFARETGAWEYIGEYAKILNDDKKNPAKTSIKTAVAGFGSSFAGLDKNPDGTYDCETVSANQDTKNACKWGQKGEGYGEGGFFYAQSADDIAASIKTFISDLDNSIPTSPSGTISIPRDPLSNTNIQPYAYLPMLEPKPSENPAVWKGNLRKYHTLKGTLYGKNSQRLYITNKSIATEENKDYPFEFNVAAEDIWQKTTGSSGDIEVGGTKAQIKVPTTIKSTLIGTATQATNLNTSQRAVFVEVIQKVPNQSNKTKRVLQEVSVKDGNLTGFDKLEGYSIIDMAYLLNYLGLPVSVDENDAQYVTFNQSIQGTDKKLARPDDLRRAAQMLKEKVAAVAPTNNRLLGGVFHSLPVLASYKGEYADGSITSDEDKRDDNIIYGSMEGALHMVAAKDGQEAFSFIPRAMFDNTKQRRALKPDTTGDMGQPAFGVDAPWTVNADYELNDTGDKITATNMRAYGGLRMGGVGFYGLNLTNKTKPSLLFSINANTAKFERLRQTWSKPLVTKIRQNNQNRQVVVFGGGYDMCYENPTFKLNDPNNADTVNNCQNKPQAQGNAVYMIDAKTGEYITHWTNTDNSAMTHSIVAEVNGIDRNNDGAVDHLYVADLGGQIFRLDLKNSATNAIKAHTTRVFNANANPQANHINYRFYERPIVSFYGKGQGRFGVINVSTGDRSSPLSKNRSTGHNRIYGIFDKDVASPAVLQGNFKSKDLTEAKLKDLDTKVIEGNKTNRQAIKTLMRSISDSSNYGWYYEMNRFAGFIDVPHLKAVGPGVVASSIYYASIYSPDYQYSKRNSCSAGVDGATEVQMYCLPWGVCADPKTGELGKKLSGTNVLPSKNGILGFTKAGPGIQEIAMTTLTNQENQSSPEGFRTIISHMTTDESRQITATTPVGQSNSGFKDLPNTLKSGNGTGSDWLGSQIKSRGVYTLKVQRWYDLADAE